MNSRNQPSPYQSTQQRRISHNTTHDRCQQPIELEQESNMKKVAKFTAVSAIGGIIGNVAHGIFVGFLES